MQKLREDIQSMSSQSETTLTAFQERISILKGTIHFFSQTCELVSSAHHQQLDRTSSSSSGKPLPMSPMSKGDGTTAATDQDNQDLTG